MCANTHRRMQHASSLLMLAYGSRRTPLARLAVQARPCGKLLMCERGLLLDHLQPHCHQAHLRSYIEGAMACGRCTKLVQSSAVPIHAASLLFPSGMSHRACLARPGLVPLQSQSRRQHWGEPAADASLCISVTIPRHLCVIARPLSATCGTHHITQSATFAQRAEISAKNLLQPPARAGTSA